MSATYRPWHLSPRAVLLLLLLGLGLSAGAGGVLLVGGWLVWRDWVPPSTVNRLPHASRTEVRELLGDPDYVGQQAWGERWEYRRSWSLAEFRVDFGRDGKVEDWSYDR
jgi:hypothetical protein